MQVDDDDDVKIKGVGSPKWGRWVFLVALIALGVVGYLQRDAIMAQVQALRGPPPDPAASFLSRGRGAAAPRRRRRLSPGHPRDDPRHGRGRA
jgi:hypothetical protein